MGVALVIKNNYCEYISCSFHSKRLHAKRCSNKSGYTMYLSEDRPTVSQYDTKAVEYKAR